MTLYAISYLDLLTVAAQIDEATRQAAEIAADNDWLDVDPFAYPPALLAARRAEYVASIHALTDAAYGQADLCQIAINVAEYNLAHVSDRNKAWAEKRLAEELEKAVNNGTI